MVDYTKLIMNEYFISDSPNTTFILPKFYDLHSKNRREYGRTVYITLQVTAKNEQSHK